LFTVVTLAGIKYASKTVLSKESNRPSACSSIFQHLTYLRRWDNNIKVNLKGIGFDELGLIHLKFTEEITISQSSDNSSFGAW
jgi:DNA modification methylase